MTKTTWTRMSIIASVMAVAACSDDSAEPNANAQELGDTLAMIDEWIQDGMYSTAAQVDAEEAQNVPDEQRHNLMYQLFARVDMDGVDGVTYFQQGSLDGTTETTSRAGILQFFVDDDAGVIRQRELNFKDVPAFIDAYKDPDKIAAITPDDVIWDEGCDFHLTFDTETNEIRGPMMENACVIEQFGQVLIAEDAVVIRPGEYEFLGRYLNEDGDVAWGNESDVLNKMTFESPLPE